MMTGNDLLDSLDLCNRNSELRISVFVVTSSIVDVARIEGTQKACCSGPSRWFCDIDSLERLAGGSLRSCDMSSRELVITRPAGNP